MRVTWSHNVLMKLTGEYHVFHLDRSAKKLKGNSVKLYSSEKYKQPQQNKQTNNIQSNKNDVTA